MGGGGVSVADVREKEIEGTRCRRVVRGVGRGQEFRRNRVVKVHSKESWGGERWCADACQCGMCVLKGVHVRTVNNLCMSLWLWPVFVGGITCIICTDVGIWNGVCVKMRDCVCAGIGCVYVCGS